MSDKAFFRFSIFLSILVFLAVALLNKHILPIPEKIPSFVYHLPTLNAFINGTCFFLLIGALAAIKNKNIGLHKKLNSTTFILSSLFLISYLTYHYMVEHTLFGGTGAIAVFYKTLLLFHIITAAGVLPLILLSFYYALKNNIKKHRKLVRFTYPIWLFVTLSGVVIYLMICPYYNFPI